MRTIENDIPEIFLELAWEGLALGIAEVSVGFWYMGSDFISPTEWSISLYKRRNGGSNPGVLTYLTATMGRGDQGPTAYIKSATDNPFDATYWGPEEIRSWMREPLEADGEYAPAWSPIEDAALQEKFLVQWPLFEAGVRSGWSMERKVSWDEQLITRRVLGRLGEEMDPEELPTMGLSWNISNSFYNLEGHPDNRETGQPVSLGGWSLLFPGKREKFYAHGDSSTRHQPVSLTETEVEELLGSNHRWFVRVARNDEELEEWFHFPEALQDPKFTIDTATATASTEH